MKCMTVKSSFLFTSTKITKTRKQVDRPASEQRSEFFVCLIHSKARLFYQRHFVPSSRTRLSGQIETKKLASPTAHLRQVLFYS